MADALEMILGLFTHTLYRNRNGVLQTGIRWMLYIATALSLGMVLAYGIFSISLSDAWIRWSLGFGACGGLVVMYGEFEYGNKRAAMVLLGLACLTATMGIMRAIYWPNLLPW